MQYKEKGIFPVQIHTDYLRGMAIALLLMAAAAISFFGYRVVAKKPMEVITCSDFKNQEEAREYYWKHEAFYLDKDGDKLPCEGLPIE